MTGAALAMVTFSAVGDFVALCCVVSSLLVVFSVVGDLRTVCSEVLAGTWDPCRHSTRKGQSQLLVLLLKSRLPPHFRRSGFPLTHQ